VGLLLVLGLGACSERNHTAAPAPFAPVGPAIDVPTPTAAQLAEANPFGDAVQRGAAVYFALSCAKCHGAIGNAPGQLGLRGGGGESLNAVRRGRAGMGPVLHGNTICARERAEVGVDLSNVN
jgi:mono/diheme cytochrome c family protein